MKKALTLIVRYCGLLVSLLPIFWVIGYMGEVASYIAGLSLFASAVAWLAFKRSRAKSGRAKLPASTVTILSFAMWLVCGLSIFAGQVTLALLGLPAEQLQSQGWLAVLGGLLSYWFAERYGAIVDRKHLPTHQ